MKTGVQTLILLFDSWIHILSQNLSIKLASPWEAKNPGGQGQNVIWEEKAEAKTIKYFAWLINKCRIIGFEFRMDAKLRTECTGILGFFHPSLLKGLKQAGRYMLSLPLQLWEKNLNLCCLVFRNPPLSGRIPLLNLTGIFLFPLRHNLRLLQYSEQLCNVKKGRDYTKCKEKAELVKIKLNGAIVRYIKKCKHDSC